MECKYGDCGWCYAPEDVENNSVQGGCFEPEYCATYLMQNKTPMTEKEHLECEIEELKIEIAQKTREIGNLKGILERKKQQQLKEMPITLQRIIEECMFIYNRQIQLDVVENILDRVEIEFFPKKSQSYQEYNEGWNDCVEELKRRLRK